MRTALKASLMLAFALAALDAYGTVLYKLTDANGRVTYVNVVPSDFAGTVRRLDIDTSEHVVTLPAAPASAANSDVRAETEYERIIRRRPDTSVADRRLREAEAKVESARAALAEAQNNSTPGDWIYFAPRSGNSTGRRAPGPEYLARIEQLERDVQLAEEQLRAAERG